MDTHENESPIRWVMPVNRSHWHHAPHLVHVAGHITRFLTMLLCVLVSSTALHTLHAQNAPPAQPLSVNRATDVIEQWRPEQHLYVKGELGVGAAQLAELEQWLDQTATNWVVLLLESAQDERFTDAAGKTYSSLDAVEHALGKGLPNQTAFGQWTDPRTGERNGAFFIFFLKERKFSYFGSDAQDRRGLGEDRWSNRLDRPAIAAMRGGGRIVDAVKDTITSIENQLTQKITAEQKQREQQEAAARAARQRALEQAQASLQNGNTAVTRLEQKLGRWLGGQASLTGDIARPDVAHMRADLSAAQAALESDNPTAARSLADQVGQRALAATRAIEDYLKTAPELESVDRALKELASRPFSRAAKSSLAAAGTSLSQAKKAYDRGDSTYADLLAQARRHVQTSESQMRAASRTAERQRQLAVAGAGMACLALLVLGVALNRRRRSARREALALYQAWSKALAEKAEALVDLLDRTQTYLGSTTDAVTARFSGQTLLLGQQVVQDVDELFIMSACAGRIHRDTKPLVFPTSARTRCVNLFAKRQYQAAIRRLRDEPIVFRPEERLELVLRGSKSPRDTLLGRLESYQPFKLSFNALMEAFNQRAESAWSALDRIQLSLGSVAETLAAIQKTIHAAKAAEAALHEASDADDLFLLAPVFDDLLPAAQHDLAGAEQTAVNDPVGALEGQATQANQKANDAQALVQMAQRFQQEFRPKFQKAADQLAAVPLPTGWITDALSDLSTRADELAQTALKSAIADPIAALNAALVQLAERAAQSVTLDQTRREVTQKLVDEAEVTVKLARHELAGALDRPSEVILREPEQDPSDRITQAREQMAAVKAALGRGDIAATQSGLEAAAQWVAEANALVEATRTAFAEHSETVTACRRETQRIEKAIPGHEQILLAIETDYAPDVLMLGQGDPTHPNANGTIKDNLEEVREHLDAARKLTDQAEQRFREAQILQSAELLRQVAARQKQSAFRLQEIMDKQQRLRDAELANDRLQSLLETRVRDLEPVVRDPRTRRRTLEAFAAAREKLTSASRRVTATPRHPFHVATALSAAQTALTQVTDQARGDWDVHAEADRSLKAALAQFEIARRLARETATDAVEDSLVIRQARAELDPLATDLDQANAAVVQSHGDWNQLDAEADRITVEAGRIAATLRSELQAAQATLAAMSSAATHARSASAWTGGLGVTIHGSPGFELLAQARELLSKGNYDQARLAAEAARRTAEAALATAVAEMRRRQRAEEERLERERRRRAAEERRRRSALSHPSMHPSHSRIGRSSFSSHSGTSRSSFSPGSGVGRSGW